MELSSEDALRINVLLSNKPLAIRINESRMLLDGLLADREVSIQLNPEGPVEPYLKAVRAVLSEYALGTPGGYPLYLQRWTRMGTMRDESLEQLLLLAEPTAVFAVVCAQGLTDELARRAWWAVEEAENARRMLETRQVVEGRTGPRLARYLIEFLPFESDSEQITESVRLALQPGLLSDEEVAALWNKSSRKGANLVGFLKARADELPLEMPPRPTADGRQAALEALAAEGSRLAAVMLRTISPGGQAFLETSARVLAKPASQDVVNGVIDAIASYLSALRPAGDPDLDWSALEREAEAFVASDEEAMALLSRRAATTEELLALRMLSGLGYGVLRPIFKRSDAIGSLMRKQLKPVLEPLAGHLAVLRG